MSNRITHTERYYCWQLWMAGYNRVQIAKAFNMKYCRVRLAIKQYIDMH
jgi:hypothetical protein